MNLIDYQEFVEGLASVPSTASFKDRLTASVLGLCGESGECLDIIYGFINGYEKEFDKNKLIDELSDVVWYVTFACSTLKIKLTDMFVFDLTGVNELHCQPVKYVLNLVSYSTRCSDFVKKHIYHSKDFNEDQFLLNLKHIVEYVYLLANSLSVSVQYIVDYNVNKLKSRCEFTPPQRRRGFLSNQ